MGEESSQIIRSTRGRALSFEALRGRAVVVFYESRDHVEDNLHLKESCGLLSESPSMRGRLEVLGIADVRGLGFVEPVVRAAVGRVAQRYGAELWLDFHGVLARAPYRFGGRGSTVAVVDATGCVVFRGDGPLDGDGLERFFGALGAALDTRAAGELARRLAARA